MDRGKQIIDGLTASVNRRVDYVALYPARVVSQNSDGTLEIKPDAEHLPGLSKVPIRYGMPGVRVFVSSGARLLIGFDGGDPTRPYASLWSADAPVSEVRVGGQDASDFVALSSLVKSEIEALRSTVNSLVTAYNGHIHITTATIGPGPAVGVLSPTASTVSPPASVGSVAAEIVKAK